MTGEASVLVAVAGSVAVGYAWGRISSQFRMPELLRLLATPVLTGALAVFGGWMLMLPRSASTEAMRTYLTELSFVDLARMCAGYSALFFVAGAAFGLPAVLGWAAGYRRPAHDND